MYVSGQPALFHCSLQGFYHKTECLLNVGLRLYGIGGRYMKYKYEKLME